MDPASTRPLDPTPTPDPTAPMVDGGRRRALLAGLGLAGAAAGAVLTATPAQAAPPEPPRGGPGRNDTLILVTAHGARGDGRKDDTAAIQRAVDSVGEAGATILFPPGTYNVSGQIALKSGVTLVGDHATIVLTTAPSDVSQIVFAIENASDVEISGLHFRFPTSRMWSILVRRGHRVHVHHCSTEGAHLITVMGPIPQSTPSSELTEDDINTDITVTDCTLRGAADFNNRDGAITVRYTRRFRVSDNTISAYSHGVQWWGGDSAIGADGGVENERKCTHGVIVGNTVIDANKGGIWGSLGAQITVTANVVDTVGDVGIDFEGCFQCVAVGNTVVDARYAGLAIFFNNRDIVFSGNTVLATKEPTDWMFWIANGQNSPDNRSVSLVGNSFLDSSGKVGKVGGSYCESVLFADNTLRNVRIEFTNRGSVHRVTDNQLYFDATAAAAFDACHVGGDRDGGATLVAGNSVRSLTDQPAESSAIRISQADPDRDTRSTVRGNITAGFPIDLHLYVNSTGPKRQHRMTVNDNDLGAGVFRRTEAGSATTAVLLTDNTHDAVPFPASVPTDGTWDRGQQIRYADPEAGGHVGAVCIAAGSPGTWKPFGAIDS